MADITDVNLSLGYRIGVDSGNRESAGVVIGVGYLVDVSENHSDNRAKVELAYNLLVGVDAARNMAVESAVGYAMAVSANSSVVASLTAAVGYSISGDAVVGTGNSHATARLGYGINLDVISRADAEVVSLLGYDVKIYTGGGQSQCDLNITRWA